MRSRSSRKISIKEIRAVFGTECVCKDQSQTEKEHRRFYDLLCPFCGGK